MEKYVVINYNDCQDCVIEIEIIAVSCNYDYANKLAFHYAKERGYQDYDMEECKIIENYDIHNYVGRESTILSLSNVVNDYRIGKVIDGTVKIIDQDVWAVVKSVTELKNVDEINNNLIYNCCENEEQSNT